MMICPILLLIASNGILSGKAGLQISPQSIAYVEENNPLTLTCIASDFNFNVFSWAIKDNVSYSIKLNTYPCEARNTIDPLTYQFSCSGNTTFKWTILHVNKQRHNEQWLCIANDVGNTKSSITSIYVQVRVTTVSFLSPTKTNVTVTENILQNFECKTSEERPRSTIQWYISSSSGSSVSLGTGNVTQADNELANTISTLRYSFNRTVSGQQLYCTAFNINGQTTVQSNRKEIIVEYGTNGPPLIDHFTSGSTYKAILLEWQSLVCSVTGGYPTPTLTWNCFNGTVTPWRSAQTVVKKNITWRASTIKASNCTCLSNQKVSGQQASSLNVDVLYPPSSPVFYINTTAVSGMVKVIRNKNIDVKCETFSNPSPTYEWSANVGGQWLRFPNVSKTDEKTFTCTVKNSMVPSEGEKQIKSAQSSFSLEVLSPPDTPIFKVGTRLISSNLSVVKGDNVRVICEATADPSPHSYSWTGQSSGNSILTINDIQTAGTRRCTAENTMTPTVGLNETKSSNALLNIVVMRGPTTPIVSFRPSAGQTTNLNEKLLVIKGTNFSLICSGSNSIPAPTYRWSGKKTSNTNIISYANVDINDYGQSTCNVENTMVRTVGNTLYGSNSSHVVIEILTQPEVEQFEAQTVVENQPLSVKCTATGNPDPTSYTWTRLQDSFLLTQSTINILNTRRDDTDNYTCTARNTMLPTVGGQTTGEGSGTVHVRILYHPDVTVSALNGTNLTETATNVILLCSAKGEPQEYNFSKWIQYAPDGLTNVKEYDSTKIEGGNAYLTFTSLSYMDSGIYHCFVRNGIEDYRTGKITASNSTLQTVKGKPVIKDGSEHDIAAAKHENSTLLVDFYTNDGSGPSVKWYKLTADSKYSLSNKDGKMLLETVPKDVSVNYHTVPVLQQGNRTQLLIQNISDSDFGEYEVEIKNSIGNTTWKIYLVAQGAPDLPSEFRDISATETNIVLSWKSGFHGGANQTFYIQYKTASSTWQNRTEIIGGLLTDTDFNATVNNLKPGTVHSFRIFAANEYGRSSFSSPIDALTSKSEEPHYGGESITGPAIGGGVGGALVIVAIVFLIVIIRKRRGGGEAGTQKKILLDGNRSKNGVKKNDDLEEVPNPMYEPAGAFQSSLNSTQNAGIKNLETTDLYATPMKTKGGKKESPGDLYSVPDKSRGGKKESPSDLYSVPDKNKGKKKEPQTDIYSFPQKGKGKQKHQKKQKEKKQKQKKGKDNLQGNVNEGLVYENADLGAGAGAIDTENVYEMTDASEPPKTSRTPNADGLIYLEVDVSRNKDATGNGKVVIHGLDDRSDYADIAFGKVGEQAPESDEEKAKENTNEG